MARHWLQTALLWLLLVAATACTPLRVLPLPSDGVSVDPDGAAATAQTEGVAVTVRLQDLQLGPWVGGERNVTSFYVVVENRGATELTLPRDGFVLLDEENRQYRAVDPEKIAVATKRSADYLIPYPYVGYYYLQDRAEYAYRAETADAFPYTAAEQAVDVVAEAYTGEAVVPGAKLAGLVYFNIDLYNKKSVVLKVLLPQSVAVEALTFPFRIDR